MENREFDTVLTDINEKLQVIFEISKIVKRTNKEILKTDDNLKLLLNRIENFEDKIFNNFNVLINKISEQENRIKNLENKLYYNSFSSN